MDFHASHQAALLLAGTVALPAPFPACASLWIVVAPCEGDCETFIRIVQHVSARRIITRFVRLADVRAIRAGSSRIRGPRSRPGRSSVKKEFSDRSARRKRSCAPQRASQALRLSWNGFPRRSCMFPRTRRCCIATTSE